MTFTSKIYKTQIFFQCTMRHLLFHKTINAFTLWSSIYRPYKWFNVKMISYQHRNSYHKDKTLLFYPIMRMLYLERQSLYSNKSHVFVSTDLPCTNVEISAGVVMTINKWDMIFFQFLQILIELNILSIFIKELFKTRSFFLFYM